MKNIKLRLLEVLSFPKTCTEQNRGQQKEDSMRIDASEMWLYRKIIRIPWTKKTNTSILTELNTEKHALFDTIPAYSSFLRPCDQKARRKPRGVAQREIEGNETTDWTLPTLIRTAEDQSVERNHIGDSMISNSQTWASGQKKKKRRKKKKKNTDVQRTSSTFWGTF